MIRLPHPLTEKNILVFDRTGRKRGRTTGSSYTCQLSGCTGLRIVVRWSDGKITRPCSKGMLWNNKHNAWKIS
jgi:hypothetical protein